MSISVYFAHPFVLVYLLIVIIIECLLGLTLLSEIAILINSSVTMNVNFDKLTMISLD